MKSVAFAGAALGLVLAAPVASQAAELFNQNLGGAGVYFGTADDATPQEFTANTAAGVDIGPRSKISSNRPRAVPAGDAYDAHGQDFNFDYSFDPGISGSEISLVGLAASITVHDFLSGLTSTFDPSPGSVPGDAHGRPNGYQNNEKITFGFLEPTYNPNLDGTFSIVFRITGLADGPLTVDNRVIVGDSVAEPTVWGSTILGFGLSSVTPRRGGPDAA